jgi:hypothetical protein
MLLLLLLQVIQHDTSTAEAVANEVQLMMQLNHPNIVRWVFKGSFHLLALLLVCPVCGWMYRRERNHTIVTCIAQRAKDLKPKHAVDSRCTPYLPILLFSPVKSAGPITASQSSTSSHSHCTIQGHHTSSTASSSSSCICVPTARQAAAEPAVQALLVAVHIHTAAAAAAMLLHHLELTGQQ